MKDIREHYARLNMTDWPDFIHHGAVHPSGPYDNCSAELSKSSKLVKGLMLQ